MITTPLDKMWCRAETKKLIREGKIRLSSCEICGAPKAEVHHLDYSDPQPRDLVVPAPQKASSSVPLAAITARERLSGLQRQSAG